MIVQAIVVAAVIVLPLLLGVGLGRLALDVTAMLLGRSVAAAYAEPAMADNVVAFVPRAVAETASDEAFDLAKAA